MTIWSPDDSTELLLVTGMSGAGRSDRKRAGGPRLVRRRQSAAATAPRPGHAQEQARRRGVALKLAAVIDVRAKQFFDELQRADHLGRRSVAPATVLSRRHRRGPRPALSVRRPHPLPRGGGRLLDGIQAERELLRELRTQADVVLDTSGLNVHQLARKIGPMVGDDSGSRLRIAVMSFGFKYGIPLDADFVFDLRFLPNPFWVPELKALTGQGEPVSHYVLTQPRGRGLSRSDGGTPGDRRRGLLERGPPLRRPSASAARATAPASRLPKRWPSV